MTSVEMGQVTLSEFESMAARFSAALKVLHEAQALIGGPPQVVHTVPYIQTSAVGQMIETRPANAPAVQPTRISAEAQAELDAWRNSAARSKLMEQFKQTPEGDAHDD